MQTTLAFTAKRRLQPSRIEHPVTLGFISSIVEESATAVKTLVSIRAHAARKAWFQEGN
jgi:hypothetical protein